MKELNKILIAFILLSCLIFWTTSADTEEPDCWIFAIQSYSQGWSENWFSIVNQVRETDNYFLTPEEQKAIITKDDLNTALLNLKKYCCKTPWLLTQNTETCQNDKTFFIENALESEHLYDHLFDVIIKRLGWSTGNNGIYYKDNNPMMTLDEKWAERRSWINEQANSPQWASPQIIIDKYQQFRAQSPSNLWYNIKQKIYTTFKSNIWAFLSYVSWEFESEDSKSVANALKNYNKRTLYDRYNNACALTEYFYALLTVWANPKDKDVTDIWWRSTCDKNVKQLIEWENNYTSLITKKASNKFLSNYIEWYMSYLYERQTKLKKLLNDIGDRRTYVSKAVPCLQRTCAK